VGDPRPGRREEIAVRACDFESEEVEPVAQSTFAEQAFGRRRKVTLGQAVPQSPGSQRTEATYQDLTLAAKHALDLAQQLVRAWRVLEGVRQ